jgi:hypothetical protein
MVATMRGTAGHDIVVHALDALRNLDHRGATGADPLVGDGAGILTQIPDEFLRASVPFALPPAGRYAAGMAYLPQDRAARFAALERVERIAREEGLVTLGWREVPVTESIVGQAARETMPFFAQLFVAAADGDLAGLELDRVAFALRKRAEREGCLLPVAVGADHRLQGHADDRSARAVLPRPVRPAVYHRAGARALAVLDQHLPELAARAPVSPDRAQRRDQHGQGQPQLDAGPGEPTLVRPHPR